MKRPHTKRYSGSRSRRGGVSARGARSAHVARPVRRGGARVAHARVAKPHSSSWGHVAEWYNDVLETGNDTYQQQVILPNLLRILEPLSGKKVVDIGCGQGFFSRALAQRGAEVMGCDIAPELIDFARAAHTPHTRFEVAPADDLTPISSGMYDSAICTLALQNIKNVNGAIAEAARVLTDGGTFIIVLNHPAFRIPKSSSWLWDEHAHVQARRIDRYMSEQEIPIDMHPGSRNTRSTISYHRPLQVYVKTLVKHGFVITGVEEWISHKHSQPGPRAAAEDTARKEFPMFMMLSARKTTL